LLFTANIQRLNKKGNLFANLFGLIYLALKSKSIKMQNQQNQQAPPAVQSKTALTSAVINSAENIKALMDLPGIEQNWIATYNKTTGRLDGELRWNAEKVLFMQLVASNKAFNDVDKFSVYSAITELAISGLTLRDGIAYILPMAKKAVFMPGWKGRLEQINEMKDVIYCNEPQVVYDCDIFEYEKGEKTKILKHVPGGNSPRTKESKITHVYFVIEFNHGARVYMMDALDVLNIRDHRSTAFKSYLALCEKHGKQLGENKMEII
jgi:recombinational DNA repair protein RecT